MKMQVVRCRPRVQHLVAACCLFLVVVVVVVYLVVQPQPSGQHSRGSADKYYGESVSDDDRLKGFPKRYTQYSYAINMPKCAPNVTLLIGICSAPRNTQQRSAIRHTWATWAHNSSVGVKIMFLLGMSEDESVQQMLRDEAHTYGDVAQETFLDTYYNLTLKSLMLLRWSITYCSGVSYVMKSDDDVFINLPNLVQYVTLVRRTNNLFGHLIHGAVPSPEKTRKHYRGDFPLASYPDYLSGTAYVMSVDVAERIFQQASREYLHYVEDVFITGICAARLGITADDHPAFDYRKRPLHKCVFRRLISAHDMEPGEMRQVWAKLHDNDTCHTLVPRDFDASVTLVVTLFIMGLVLVLILFLLLDEKCR